MANVPLTLNPIAHDIALQLEHLIQPRSGKESVLLEKADSQLGTSVNVRMPMTFDPNRTFFAPPIETYDVVVMDQMPSWSLRFEDRDLSWALHTFSRRICELIAFSLARQVNDNWPPGESLVVGNLQVPSGLAQVVRVQGGSVSVLVAKVWDAVHSEHNLSATMLCGVTGGWRYQQSSTTIPLGLSVSMDELLARRALVAGQLDRLKAA